MGTLDHVPRFCQAIKSPDICPLPAIEQADKKSLSHGRLLTPCLRLADNESSRRSHLVPLLRGIGREGWHSHLDQWASHNYSACLVPSHTLLVSLTCIRMPTPQEASYQGPRPLYLNMSEPRYLNVNKPPYLNVTKPLDLNVNKPPSVNVNKPPYLNVNTRPPVTCNCVQGGQHRLTLFVKLSPLGLVRALPRSSGTGSPSKGPAIALYPRL